MWIHACMALLREGSNRKVITCCVAKNLSCFVDRNQDKAYSVKNCVILQCFHMTVFFYLWIMIWLPMLTFESGVAWVPTLWLYLSAQIAPPKWYIYSRVVELHLFSLAYMFTTWGLRIAQCSDVLQRPTTMMTQSESVPFSLLNGIIV